MRSRYATGAILVGAFCLGGVVPLSSWAEPEELAKTHAATPSDAQHKELETPDAAPTPMPKAAAKEEELEPLDSWHDVEMATPTPTPLPLELLDPSFLDEEGEEIAHTDERFLALQREKLRLLVPGGRESPVTAQERKRLRALNRKVRSRVLRGYKLRRSAVVDPRGKPELIVCSVNFNNYGLKDEVKRMLKKAGVAVLRSKEQSLIAAILDAKCDVVAVQGLIGRSFAFAASGLREFAEKLDKATKTTEWNAFTSESVGATVFSGFLVKKSAAEVYGSRTYVGKLLEYASAFPETAFARNPFEIDMRVKRKGADSSRRVILLNFHFQRGLRPLSKDSESYRVQMADALRRLLNEAAPRGMRPFDEDPIKLVSGERVVAGKSAHGQVLEGTLTLEDFVNFDRCKLSPLEIDPKQKKLPKKEGAGESKLTCSERPARPKLLVNVVTDPGTLPVRYRKKRDKKEGTVSWVRLRNRRAEKQLAFERERREAITQSVYIEPGNLFTVLEKHGVPNGYKVKTVPVKNGLPNSPLVAVTINW